MEKVRRKKNRKSLAVPSDPSGMSTGELLNVQPQDLQFPFELRKQISCSLQLSNKTDNHVAFQVTTTNPKKYCVRPNTRIVLPRSTCDVIVTMQAQEKAPPDMQCNDKFLLQSVVASPGALAEDITPKWFKKNLGHHVDEFELRVLYVAPPRPQSSVLKGRIMAGIFSGLSVSENRHLRASEFTVPKAFNERVDHQETSSESLAIPSDPSGMSTGELLNIQPQDLQFPFELRKQISCSLQLSNKTDNYVAFKVKTTNAKKYCVRPDTGIVLPRSNCDVIVTMQAQEQAPLDRQCRDKFLLQSVVASPGATTEDITPNMFNKESGHHVEECKLTVLYVAPPQPPSPIREGSEEDSSPSASLSENEPSSASESTVPKAFNERVEVEPQEPSSEVERVCSSTQPRKTEMLLKNSLGNIPKGMAEEHEVQKLKKKIVPNNSEEFLYETLCNATNNFDPNNFLGGGGYGDVYKGELKDGRDIAVKKSQQPNISRKQYKESFLVEVELLNKVKHGNVVKLFGYCFYDSTYLLVYEYVPNKSLDKYLPNKSLDNLFGSQGRDQHLDWTQRFGIIKGIANGLSHLHANRIVHRDIKPENILLDNQWKPKVADFGISRLFDVDGSHISTNPRGTDGYIAPEYYTDKRLYDRSDVYSFGVLMLEIISGTRLNSTFKRDNGRDLLDWAYSLFNANKTLKIMDPALANLANLEQVKDCIIIALQCVQGNPYIRPHMEEVVSMLTNQVHLNKSIEEPGLLGFAYYKLNERRKQDDSLREF